jgi:hypothetical protein
MANLLASRSMHYHLDHNPAATLDRTPPTTFV